MTSHKNFIIIFLIICASFLLILLLHLYNTFFLPKYYGISIADIVLIITAGAIFWYAWETRRMRQEIFYQNMISTMPNLNFYVEQGERQFYLENYSNFPAFAVSIAEKELDKNIKFVFKEVNSVLPKQRRTIPVIIFADQKEITDQKERLSFLHGLMVNKPSIFNFETTATYVNNMGRKYTTTLRCGTGGKFQIVL